MKKGTFSAHYARGMSLNVIIDEGCWGIMSQAGFNKSSPWGESIPQLTDLSRAGTGGGGVCR